MGKIVVFSLFLPTSMILSPEQSNKVLGAILHSNSFCRGSILAADILVPILL